MIVTQLITKRSRNSCVVSNPTMEDIRIKLEMVNREVDLPLPEECLWRYLHQVGCFWASLIRKGNRTDMTGWCLGDFPTNRGGSATRLSVKNGFLYLGICKQRGNRIKEYLADSNSSLHIRIMPR